MKNGDLCDMQTFYALCTQSKLYDETNTAEQQYRMGRVG